MSTVIEGAQSRRIKFAKPDTARFFADVKTRVAQEFERTGRSTKADAGMVAKTVILLTLTFGSYALIIFGGFSLWTMLLLCVLMGVGMAGVWFSVAHDALHGAYSSNQRVNRLLGYSFDILGANGYMWKITHNVIHHTYTNIPGVDEDLTVSPLLRLSPGAPLLSIHRWQHIYGWLTYSLATLNWIFMKDFQQFMKRDIGPYVNKKHPRSEIATLIIGKLICYGWTIVIPLLVLDVTWWQFVIGFTALHLTAGTIMGVIFQLAHVVEGNDYPVPDDGGQMENAWLIHEMETTANFAPRNRLLSWYVGGLNYQIEHHLFPQVCSIHYRNISGIVQKTAQECNVPYNSFPTLRAAMRSHYRMLRQLGRQVQVAG